MEVTDQEGVSALITGNGMDLRRNFQKKTWARSSVVFYSFSGHLLPSPMASLWLPCTELFEVAVRWSAGGQGNLKR
jgi:hypothetical protein